MEDDDENIYSTFCPECEENAALSPVSGLCYDCENADEDEEDSEPEDGEEQCEGCSSFYDEEALEDGICWLCRDEEEE